VEPNHVLGVLRQRHPEPASAAYGLRRIAHERHGETAAPRDERFTSVEDAGCLLGEPRAQRIERLGARTRRRRLAAPGEQQQSAQKEPSEGVDACKRSPNESSAPTAVESHDRVVGLDASGSHVTKFVRNARRMAFTSFPAEDARTAHAPARVIGVNRRHRVQRSPPKLKSHASLRVDLPMRGS
jgi:hypothetical protein